MDDIFKKRIGAYNDQVIGLFKDPVPDTLRLRVIKGRQPPPISYHDYLKWIERWPVGERVYDIDYNRRGTVNKVYGEFPKETPRVYVVFDDGSSLSFGMGIDSIRPLNALERLSEA